jgi:hypothetical protein
MPFAFVSAAMGSCIIYSVILNTAKPDLLAFAYIVVAVWTSFVFAEQLCIVFLLMLKNRMNATIAVTYILVVCLALASGTVRYGYIYARKQKQLMIYSLIIQIVQRFVNLAARKHQWGAHQICLLTSAQCNFFVT